MQPDQRYGMRAGVVVVGLVLIVLGAVLMFVPLVQSPSADLSSANPSAVVDVSGFSLLGTVPGTLSWTSNQPVNMSVVTCSSIAANKSCSGTITILSSENGTSGSFSFSVAPGGGVGVGMNGGNAATASVAVKLAQTTIGLVVAVLGLILLLVGAALHKKTPPAPAPAPPPAPPSS